MQGPHVRKSFFSLVVFLGLACALALLTAPAHASAESAITPSEARWLKAAWPVLLFARDSGLPVDIVVQPQATPGVPPMAMAYLQGRCKLVFSMRGNPEVRATEERLASELFDGALQLMAAHELGHCQRHVSGAWRLLPSGLAEPAPAAAPRQLDARMRADWLDMQAVRREEGYADLVGLAWTHQHQPAQYAQLLSWLLSERSQSQTPGSHHDTRAWARLATQPAQWVGESIYKPAESLWLAGLQADF
jgi:hypothetical protein